MSSSDNLIKEKFSNIYKKKFIKKVAFPTYIFNNEVCRNFSPLAQNSYGPHESKTLSEGDVVKISLGVEIKGFAALVRNTFVIGKKRKKKGNKADAILAAYNSIQNALRMMAKEKTNNNITYVISKICKDYNVNLIEDLLSHWMKKDIIDGLETIINKSIVVQKVDKRK